MPHPLPARILGLALSVLPVAAMAGDRSNFETFGDGMQIVLPTLAAVCAARQDRLADLAAGFALAELVTQTSKAALGSSAINRRPNGGSGGFPSGHTMAATFGAADLARHCWPDAPVAGAIAYGAAALVGASRIEADKHNFGQVLAGALVGYFATGVTLDLTDDRVSLGYTMPF